MQDGITRLLPAFFFEISYKKNAESELVFTGCILFMQNIQKECRLFELPLKLHSFFDYTKEKNAASDTVGNFCILLWLENWKRMQAGITRLLPAFFYGLKMKKECRLILLAFLFDLK